MRDQRSQDPEQRGAEPGKYAEPGARSYGRAIDCAARRADDRRPAAGHGPGARERGAEESHYLRG